ncbi:hypothetical protein ATU3B_24520 [Agrobacterium genomosp. 3 str. CIP 111-78]|uniref:Uncharacterized protein n=1 Tax=Agrobacterium tumefaciens TaxID=358 RepID=A0AAE6BMI3_AGRTU|nr:MULTISPECIES: hypothetical protein [Agrobacterium tumefaciens complex]MCA2374795.1 hypothetical protein [Agrobacterium tomkonis CIP 111-78]QCM00209.1 hypothetical protein CFBP6624_08695 [Agrobacterium tumefaciens]
MLTKVKIYRVNGEEYEMSALDAREAVTNHPDEYSLAPWTKMQKQAALEKALKADIDAIDA